MSINKNEQQWTLTYSDEFEIWIKEQEEAILEEFRVKARILQRFGPRLGRPHVDTLNGSRHSNMKELRFTVDGHVIRITFVFAPNRNGVFLTGGEKQGVSEKKFYKDLIKKSDEIYDKYLGEHYGKK